MIHSPGQSHSPYSRALTLHDDADAAHASERDGKRESTVTFRRFFLSLLKAHTLTLSSTGEVVLLVEAQDLASNAWCDVEHGLLEILQDMFWPHTITIKMFEHETAHSQQPLGRAAWQRARLHGIV